MKTAHCVARFNIANCLGGVLKSFGWHCYMVSGHTQEKQNLANILQTYIYIVTCEYLTMPSVSYH